MVNARLSRDLAAAIVVAIGVSGCNLRDVEPPPPTGPSEFAMAIDMTAAPDLLPEDGASQSVISITLRNGEAQPMRSVPLYVETTTGQLSTSNAVTDANGRATVVFTAPRTAFPGFDAGNMAFIFATPIGTNADNARTGNVAIRLVPPSVILAPGAPIADFTFSPAQPKAGTLVLFNGAASVDRDGTIVSYVWNWGDGDVSGTGVNQDHDFLTAGTYFVTLTVTDNAGLSGSATKSITVVP
jgi:PKD repeat protein